MFKYNNKVMMGKVLLVSLVFILLLLPTALAIPTGVADDFKLTVREQVDIDAYWNSSERRIVILDTYFNLSSSYYITIRKNPADVYPYDNFKVCLECYGDYIDTCVYVDDYSSWVQNGQISFFQSEMLQTTHTFGNLTVNMSRGYCFIDELSDFTLENNGEYSYIYVELIPLLDVKFTTINTYCETKSANDLITAELTGIQNVFDVNVNFFYTLYIMFQIIALITVVIGAPIMVFVMIRWMVWKVTGHKMLERRT